jgi:bacillithiol biosynthesis cysteine-adding enzyme BshC
VEQEIACRGSNGNVVLRVESFPFSRVPTQSKLFEQFQDDPLSLRRFYPTVVSSHTEIADRIPEVLANYSTDRKVLCDALIDINRRLDAGDTALDNIELLRDEASVAVVTGQQAGLFTGPLYTIYKALSVVRAAECLRGRGFKAVPIFWIATEDHDLDEVNRAFVLDRQSEIVELRTDANNQQNVPVGAVSLTSTISVTVAKLFDSLNSTEFSSELRKLLTRAFEEADTFGTAFGRLLARLMGQYGLVLVDPLDVRLKRLASPIYTEAIRKSPDIVKALLERNDELRAAGFEPQVAVGADYFPLFWHSDDGERTALRSTSKGSYKAKNSTLEFSLDELARLAESEPTRFSPNVVLRPVVQDYLFPTVCYFGGGAEISYFAQNSVVYGCLGRPVTPILHRQSFTVVESKHSRTMQAYELGFTDIFKGLDELLPRIVDEHLDRRTAATFAEVEEIINTQLNRLDRELSEIDPTLGDNLATRRRKIVYHIGALRKKFRSVEVRKDQTIHRRLVSMFSSLLPNGALQERSLNITYFLNQYGPRFVEWMYNAADLDDRSHRVIYL